MNAILTTIHDIIENVISALYKKNIEIQIKTNDKICKKQRLPVKK